MANILPRDLPPAGTVPSGSAIIIDNGVGVEKATPMQVVDSARPQATQTDALAGTDNTKSMTPLRVREAIMALSPLVSGNVAETLADLKAYATDKGAVLAAYSGGTPFTWTLGDFTGQADDVNIVKSDSTDLSVGAWVRQSAEQVQTVQSGTGAVARTTQDKLRERVSVFDFGAVGDGVTDDTAAVKAAMAALRSGGTLELGNGYTFLISESLVLEKPVAFLGSTMDQSRLLFALDGSYVDIGDGTLAAIILLHPQTVLPPYSGYGGRSSFTGLTAVAETGAPAGLRGFVICAPAYFYEVRAENFPSDGFAVMAGDESPIDGNANGTVFMNGGAQANGGHGYYFLGNDTNACLINRCYSADNGGWGYYDDSLLGNTYVACEADNNDDGGYFANPAKPQSSSYLGCYSETPPYFSVGPQSQAWGAQGLFKPSRASGGVIIRGLPNGAAYCTQPVRIATTDDIANSLGDASAPGAAVQLSEGGLEIRFRAGEGLTRFVSDYSADYASLVVSGTPSIWWPNKVTVGNLRPGRAWFLEGIVFGSAGGAAIVGSGTAAPTTGTYSAGAIYLNDAPAAGGKIGWVCVTGGSPGTWKPFGAIDA